MIKFPIFQIFLVVVSYSYDAAAQDNELLSFLNKFEWSELPVDINDGCGSRNANDESNISENEALLYLGIDGDLWKYHSDFYYNTGCKFHVGDDKIGVIFYRAFLPFDFSKQVAESVLLILDKSGESISSIPIQGSKGDDMTYAGSISKEMEIVIKYEELKLNESGDSDFVKSIKRYRIAPESGEIVFIGSGM